MLDLVIAFLPIGTIGLSLLSYWLLPFRKIRLIAYSPFLVCAIVAGLLNISLRSDLPDIFFNSILLFMTLEFVWLLLEWKNVVWRALVILIVIFLVGKAHFAQWSAGLGRQRIVWQSEIVASYNKNNDNYIVKRQRVFAPDSVSAKGRTPMPPDNLLSAYSLFKQLDGLPLERFCDRYLCPREYANTAFFFEWAYGLKGDNLVGRNVALKTDGYTLWTLKETLLVPQ